MKPDLIRFTDSAAKVSSMRAGQARGAAANRALRRIEGEVLTVKAAAARAGVTEQRFRDRYRKGARTWAALGRAP